jgi:lysophospholipase L1-like esterase
MHSFIKQIFNSINNKTKIRKDEKLSSNHMLAQAIYGGNGFVTTGTNVVTPNPNVPFRGNKQEYVKRFSQLKPQTLKAQSAYFIATLKRLNDLGTKVVVVDMPMLAPVRNLLPVSFWSNYSAQLKKDCQENGAYLLDLSNDPEFSQAYFLDYVHLNSKGGQLFVDRLARSISNIY